MTFTKITKAADSNNGAIWQATIAGQTWTFQIKRYWSPGVGCGATDSVCECQRTTGKPQSLTTRTRKRAVEVIAERIADGTY